MQSAENKDLMNQFIGIMKEQNMGEQAQEVNSALLYIVNLQAQMMAMTKELQDVKEQLNAVNKEHNDIVSRNDIKMVSKIQRRALDLSEQLGKLKENTIGTIKEAVNTYKTNGKEQMKKLLMKGTSSIQNKLQWCKNVLQNILNLCKEANRRLDAIGNELAQIGDSIGNIGKIATGKELRADKVSSEKEGVTLIRMLKAPISKAISLIEKQINKIDSMINKMERFSERLNSKEIVNDKAVEAILSNTELSVMDKAEQLINLKEKDKAVFDNSDKNLIMNYAYKTDDIEKVHQLIEQLENSINKIEHSPELYVKIVNKTQMEIKSIDLSHKNKESNAKESVLNKLHSNQEKVKNNEQKGEERVVKKEEIQK